MSAAIDEEEEILLSIFPDEFEKLDAHTFRIRIDPDDDVPSSGAFGSAGLSQLAGPTLLLTATLPPDYPDSIPTLSIESLPPPSSSSTVSSSTTSGVSSSDVLTDVEVQSMLTSLHETCVENTGIAMLFTLISHAKELRASLMLDRAAERQRAEEVKAAEVRKSEAARFEGTKVTRESFEAWNASFKAELARRQDLAQHADDEAQRGAAGSGGAGKGGAGQAGHGRLTGRQLFEGDKSLAQSDVKIGDSTDVEFDFSKFAKTHGRRNADEDGEEEEEESVRHWAAESI